MGVKNFFYKIVIFSRIKAINWKKLVITSPYGNSFETFLFKCIIVLKVQNFRMLGRRHEKFWYVSNLYRHFSRLSVL